MIIKTLRWKVEGGFGRLVDYVGKQLLTYVGKDGNQMYGILHNLRHTDDLDEIAEQFAENDSYRKQRKNGVSLYHEILSFHADDRDAITLEKLEDITREYLRIRAPRALAFACPHFDRDHVHVHIAISGTEYKSAKTLRIDNRTFTSVRRDMEHYQLTHYPELSHSIVHLPKRVRNNALQEEILREKPVVQRCYDGAVSLEDFLDRLSAAGVAFSKYPLRPSTGHYDFEIDTSRLSELDERMLVLNALEKLRVVRDAMEHQRDEVLDDMIERGQPCESDRQNLERIERMQALDKILKGSEPARDVEMHD